MTDQEVDADVKVWVEELSTESQFDLHAAAYKYLVIYNDVNYHVYLMPYITCVKHEQGR
jgi:hypothetical protein